MSYCLSYLVEVSFFGWMDFENISVGVGVGDGGKF